MRQAEQASEAIAGGDGHDDHARDADDQRRSGGQHRPYADGRAQKDDGDLQQYLAAELDPRTPSGGRRPTGADHRAEQDGDHQRLQPRPPQKARLNRLQDERRRAHRQAQQHAREKPHETGAGSARGGARLGDLESLGA